MTISIHIGGSALVYQLDEPRGDRMAGPWPRRVSRHPPQFLVKLRALHPSVRYGVPYVVAIECSDGRLRSAKCHAATPIGRGRFP